MLDFYIDDSGKDGPPVFVLAGYVARPDDWMRFSDRWQAILNQEPRLEYLKAEEAFSLRKQFAGWTAPQHDARLMEFIAVIRDCAMAQVESVIYYADFDALIRQNRGPFKTPANFAMTSIIVGNLDAMRKEHRREEMEFFFDQDVVKPNELRMAYRLLKWRMSDEDKLLLPHEPIMRDDKRFVPLQAADLYAWHVRRDHFERTRDRTLSTDLWTALNCHYVLDCSSDRQLMTDILHNLPFWPRHLPKPPKRQKQ